MLQIRETQVEQNFTNETEVVVQHNKNQKPDLYHIYDESYIEIQPESFSNDSGNACTITFSEPKSGQVVLIFKNLIIDKGDTNYKVEVNDTNDGLKVIETT